MSWSFPGIVYPVECVYTQTRGVHADAIQLMFLPQPGNFPTSGTLTLTWDGSVSLPNCIIDTSTLHYASDGIHHIVLAWDRRKLWENAPPIDGWYNVERAGVRVPSRQRSLQQLCRILLDRMGETSASVAAVSGSIYPEVRWDSEPVHLALEALMRSFGLDLVLGFGSENPAIVVVGDGAALPSGNEFVQSITADPKLRPRFIRSSFGPSVGQGRFILEAVGRETATDWVPINDLSYAPAGTGWAKEDPYTLPTVLANGLSDWKLAINSVFRAYRIVTFSDGSLNLPDGSGSISRIEDVLPLLGNLIATEDIRSDNAYKPFRLFGRFFREIKERGQPAEFENTEKDYELTYIRSWLDLENGILFFEDPIFLIEDDEFAPAELYLEVAFRVKNQSNFAPAHYIKDVDFDTSGYGYHTIFTPEVFYKVIVSYDADHSPTGVITNQADLDATAASQASLISSSMANSMTQVKTYSIPKLSIRCDGAITQVQHVITNGEKNHKANRTTASRFRDFDRKIPSQARKAAHYQSLRAGLDRRWKDAISKREDPTDA